MLTDLRSFNRKYGLIAPGDTVVCAVSGGADSMALLWAMYLLKEEWDLDLSAAHFNHHLRGEESHRDEQFVREFCEGYGIPLHVGSAEVRPGKKGLEAAARDARYAFLRTLPGKIATAHTADDNAETVLLHLVRGTGLKGLGGIMPRNGNVIRPMLGVTRRQVEKFLEEYAVGHISDSSNDTDAFLRNRLRRHVMPLLASENPRIAENLSAMALRLRQDEKALAELAKADGPVSVKKLRNQPAAIRTRALEAFLKESGVKEPEAEHIALAEALIFTDKPSAAARFPGSITIARNYDTLEVRPERDTPQELVLSPGETVRFGDYRITCVPAEEIVNTDTVFTVDPAGTIRIRSRQTGDALRLKGGNKSVKKRFIDKKIPAAIRHRIPVICDDAGILAVGELGTQLHRRADMLPAVTIRMVKTSES
ncbi:MAG: tRNA lysidine(34) synthetase TilS [Oscillospiraceae bacterium]|nr:tRNA lysidine(34) synthetase TilS [Oscillospiraceae bacterium]